MRQMRYTIAVRFCSDLRGSHIRIRMCSGPAPPGVLTLGPEMRGDAAVKVLVALPAKTSLPASGSRPRGAFVRTCCTNEPSGEKTAPERRFRTWLLPKRAFRRQILAGRPVFVMRPAGTSSQTSRTYSVFFIASTSSSERNASALICSLYSLTLSCTSCETLSE